MEEEIEAKIFFNIVENGPISIYAASNKKKDSQNPPFATVHRYFKNLESENLITIYKKEMHQNKKFKYLYGPTSEGIAEFYFSEKGKIIKDIKLVFDKWGNNKKFFQDENGIAIFDFNEFKKNPMQVLTYFKKWVEFIGKADDYKEIPEELDLDVGMMILGKKEPKYFLETILDLYENIPAFRTELDQYFKNILNVYEFIQKIQKEPRNPTYITQKLLLKYSPMMTPKEMKKIQHSKEPKFNFEISSQTDFLKHFEFKNMTLTKLATTIFNKLLRHNYAMLVCKPDYSVINEEEIKFIMAHCANNFSKAGYTISFEELYRPEWYDPELPPPKNDTLAVMINPYSDHIGPIAAQFYDNFEIFVPNMDEITPEFKGIDDRELAFDDKIKDKIEEKRKLAEKNWKIRREILKKAS